jgi:adenosylhomocysteine nucleosidase
MIGIIAAMDEEIKEIEKNMKIINKKNICGIEFLEGYFLEKHIIAAKCGIGKVFGSMGTSAMISNYEIELIINVGVAGNLCSDIKIGDVVVANCVAQHDFDMSALNKPIGYIEEIKTIYIPCKEIPNSLIEDFSTKQSFKTYKGKIATGDKFVDDCSTKNFIKENFNALACDMESGAIGQVCYFNNIEFIIIKGISDNADDTSSNDLESFTSIASENSNLFLKFFLNKSQTH